MTDRRLSDAQLRDMLTSVADDTSIGHPDREQLRDEVLAELRTLATAGLRSDEEATVVDLDPMSGPGLRSGVRSRKRPTVWLAAAAVIAAIVASVAVLRQPQTANTISAAGLPTLAEGTGGGPLPAGSYLVENVAGGVVITLPEGMEVADVGPGFIELRPAEDAWGSSLFLMTAEESLEELVAVYEDAGLATLVVSAAVSSEGQVLQTEVRPTNKARADGCREDPECLVIGPTRFSLDGINIARQIDGPTDRRLLSLYRSDTLQSPLERQASGLLDTLEFAADS